MTWGAQCGRGPTEGVAGIGWGREVEGPDGGCGRIPRDIGGRGAIVKLMTKASEMVVCYAVGGAVLAEGGMVGEMVECDGNVGRDSEVGSEEDVGCYDGQFIGGYWGIIM
jgi:hypothetical protein